MCPWSMAWIAGEVGRGDGELGPQIREMSMADGFGQC